MHVSVCLPTKRLVLSTVFVIFSPKQTVTKKKRKDIGFRVSDNINLLQVLQNQIFKRNLLFLSQEGYETAI